MMPSSVNRHNLGRQILAARAIADLTRVELAKEANLGHATVKLAEDGDKAALDEALAKICRAIEARGFEFIDGTASISLAFHGAGKEFGVTADPTMPGYVRRIYPRTLDARGLVRDLDACGVEIENEKLLLEQCATKAPWPETFVQMAAEGRKFGIRFFWRNDVENKDGVRHVLKPYRFDTVFVNDLLRNILTSDAPTL
jgi:DNA-binding XRE family transcriptional regulator